MNQILTGILAIALVVLIIYRQMRTMPVQARQLILFPVVLAILGIINLTKAPLSSSGVAVAFVASVLAALIFGVARGVTTYVWRDGGIVMRKGSVVTLTLWVVAIGVRFGIAFAARGAGVPLKVTTAEFPIFLAITLGAQNVLIWLRAMEVEEGSEVVSAPSDARRILLKIPWLSSHTKDPDHPTVSRNM